MRALSRFRPPVPILFATALVASIAVAPANAEQAGLPHHAINAPKAAQPNVSDYEFIQKRAQQSTRESASNWIRVSQTHTTRTMPKLGAPSGSPANTGHAIIANETIKTMSRHAGAPAADALGDLPGLPDAGARTFPGTRNSDITLKRGVVGAQPLPKLQQPAIDGKAPAKTSIPPQFKALIGGLQ
jgi:hypothetical protein